MLCDLCRRKLAPPQIAKRFFREFGEIKNVKISGIILQFPETPLRDFWFGHVADATDTAQRSTSPNKNAATFCLP